MGYYLIVGILIVAAFMVGFFVGKKHGERVGAAAQTLKDTVGKL